jgi:hypothetical protein
MAVVVMGLVWLGGRSHRAGGEVARERGVVGVPQGVGAVKEEVWSEPCVSAPPRVVRESAAERKRELVGIVRATMAASHPAPPMGLTAQERELVQLSRSSDAKELVTPDPEMRAKAEAQNAAEFQRFFGEPAQGETVPVAVPSVDNQ